MADDVLTRRAQTQAHQDRLTEGQWLSPRQLADRWGISPQTVRDIPADELPYREFGSGLKLRRRRYAPTAVAAFEAQYTRPQAKPRGKAA